MKVKAKIDGRPVAAEIIADPWAEAARAFRNVARVMNEVLPKIEDPRE